MAELDHIAVAAATLGEGAAWVERALGVPLQDGGKHPTMGTHNRLLGLGPGLYLEVIAVDPEAPPPPRARWFRLDEFAGPPRLTNWIVRTGGLEAALALAPPGAGEPMAFARGDYRWRMAVPADGRLPYDDAFPALIEWEGTQHPSDRLTDRGCRLARLEVTHPDAASLRAALPLQDARVTVTAGPPSLRAVIATPAGERVLA